jgi:hypothetical protein
VIQSFFNDITYGDNKCCGGYTSIVCCSAGFSATTGWDPVTVCSNKTDNFDLNFDCIADSVGMGKYYSD